jgi:hypothetical protein
MGTVSSSGRYSQIKLLKPIPMRRGYYRVNLYKNGHRKCLTIAALVLETFVGPRPKGHHAAHLNGINNDNRLENLAWCSPKENDSHKNIHGTRALGESHGCAKLTRNAVETIRREYIKGKHGSALSLAKRFGVRKTAIHAVANGYYWRDTEIAREALK